MAISSASRCLYEVLNLSRDCTRGDIRSAYKRLALQLHPDKLALTGVPPAEANDLFQELVNAYEVLSDAIERAWYDSHRDEILAPPPTPASHVPDLFSFFWNSVYRGYSDTGKGFYKVYGDAFDMIYASELNLAKKFGLGLPKEAPVIGKLGSSYAQVKAFYNYWLGFATVLDFSWANKNDGMEYVSSKVRKCMEEENKKLRRKARREYNETVRRLVKFVRKRDKRVIDMQVKRAEEIDRKREEAKQRKTELGRQKSEENARNYEEPEWEMVEDDDVADDVEEKIELYCVVCSKTFKSDKQWKNHERSKKHKDEIAELREALSEEDKEYEVVNENYLSENERVNELEQQFEGYQKEEFEIVDVDENNLSENDGLNVLEQKLEGSVGIQDDDDDDDESNEGNEFVYIDYYYSGGNGVVGELGSDDDEVGVLEAMLLWRKNRNKVTEKIEVEMDSDELELMDCSDTTRRNRGCRRWRMDTKQQEDEETMKAGVADRNNQGEERDDGDTTDDSIKRGDEIQQQDVGKKNTIKKRRRRQVKEAETMEADDVAETINSDDDENREQDVRKKNRKKQDNATRGRKEKVRIYMMVQVCPGPLKTSKKI